MFSFIVRRLSQGIIVVVGVIVLTFLVARILPSDPARMYAGQRATPEQLEEARHALGLDRPMYVQLGRYFVNFFKGDLGISLVSKKPVAEEISTYLPATLELTFCAVAIALGVGLPLGILAASRKDRWPDHASRVMAVGMAATPVFWSALLLQFIFYRKLGLLPFGGVMSDEIAILHSVPAKTHFPLLDALIAGDFGSVWNQITHLILPSLCLCFGSMSSVMRLTRTSMIEILHEDYIVAERSYGLHERTVLWKLALKNSMGPTATVVALLTAYVLVNTFLVEALFSWPGIGSYIANAVTSLDFPAIVGVTLVASVAFVVLNILADIVVALDPRVRRT